MARPKGAKSDPIGQVFVRVERDIQYITARFKALKGAYRKMKMEKAKLSKMGL